MVETREQYMTRTGFWPGFPMDHYSEEAFASMQRAAEYGPHGHSTRPAGWFAEARRAHARATQDGRPYRRFGRNPKEHTPPGV